MNTQQQNIEEGTKMTDAMEQVVSATSGEGLSPESIAQARKELDYLNPLLGTNDIETILFCTILNSGSDHVIEASEIARALQVSNIRFIDLTRYLDNLLKKRLIRGSRSYRDSTCWRVPFPVIKAIRDGRTPDCEDITGLSTRKIFNHLYEIFKNITSEDLLPEHALREIEEIIEHNRGNEFVKKLQAYGLESLGDPTEQLCFYYMLHRAEYYSEAVFLQEEFDQMVVVEDMDGLPFPGLHEDSCSLFERNVLEHYCDNGHVDENKVVLTDFVLEDLLKGLYNVKGETDESETIPRDELVPNLTIRANQLFYNEEEAQQMKTLEQLLQKDTFDKVQERLEKKGMSNGFTVLFYGAPGTGKTASVFELARKSGRDLYFVDQTKLRSKWHGESGKALKKLFKRYKDLVEKSEHCPILVLNECDSLMYRRIEDTETSSDQLNNSMVNIILNELDNFKGILIATSNLAGGLDDAFERRILYKVEFNKPEVKVREQIWKSKVEELQPAEVADLAASYKFTGAQIENIARKANINYVITGKDPDLASIRDLCANEHIRKQQSRQKIGF